MILENIYQASKPQAASAPSYHAPSHAAVPLSAQPVLHRTYMRASRVGDPNIDRSSTCGNARIGAISDLDAVADVSFQSPSVEFVPLLPPDNESMKFNVQASAGSESNVRLRAVRSTFVAVDHRRSMSVC